ncbi:hypothetical protein N7468_010616 [Penicillium chermesinum]|uniref:Uncharacterized protein n=1 Tax=Penicillium chermesinum TaxID=63820 RepID=A0A9W9T9W5_9EURO|nr:uncharacterized protein N7468_010616 [Penicillium chermesinum]KAJ5214937.1 hypothetical protein N7468_010616 [Penicillium chermesinum]
MPDSPPTPMTIVSPGQDIQSILSNNERVHETEKRIVGRYASEETGLGVPASLAQYDLQTQRLIVSDSNASEGTIGVPTQQQDIVKFEEQKFIQKLRDYEQNAKPKYRTWINIDGLHTLAEVWEILDLAVAKYKDKDRSGAWGRVRRAFRGLGQNGEAVEKWLGMVPSQENYLSVICGGVKLILGAAARMSDIRDSALSGLHDIPVLLSGAQRVLGIYNSSQQLKALSASLYVATLTSLGHILHYIGRNSASKALEAMFKQSSFQRDLSRSLEAMQKCRDSFNEEARICGIEMQGEIESVLQDTHSNAQEIQGELVLMHRSMLIAYNEQKRTQRLIEEEALCLEERIESMKKGQAGLQESLNQLLGLVKGNPLLNSKAWAMNRPFDAPHNPFISLVANPSQTQSATAYTMGDLRRIVLSRLVYNSKRMQADVQENYDHGATMPIAQQDRCVYVINSPQLASWTTSQDTKILVINGHQASRSLRSPPELHLRATPIHFFCGEHSDRHDKLNSATAIINNLLAQLLSSFKDINYMNLIALGDFDSNDIKAVCQRFKAVLKLLPASAVVFCLVDNLPPYLINEKTSEGARNLLHWLIRWTHRRRNLQEAGQACTFKLLLTAEVQFMEPEIDALDEAEVMNVPVTVPPAGGFTDMKWDTRVGSEVDKMI